MGREVARIGRILRVSAITALCIFCEWSALSQSSQNNANSTANSTDANQKTSPPNQSQNLSPAEKRRADLMADTEKLYQLTQELKAEVARSNKDTLSVAVVKKAQEVERLAKSIKERSRQQ